MQFETLFAPAREKPVVAALIGCGEFGMSLIAQSRRMEGLTIRAVADLDPGHQAGDLEGAPPDMMSTSATAAPRQKRRSPLTPLRSAARSMISWRSR